MLLRQPSCGRGEQGACEVTLPSWAQQGQKERGLRRGVPALGSTSIGPNEEEEEAGEEEEVGSGTEEERIEIKDKQRTKSIRVRKKGNTRRKEKKKYKKWRRRNKGYSLQMNNVPNKHR